MIILGLGFSHMLSEDFIMYISSKESISSVLLLAQISIGVQMKALLLDSTTLIKDNSLISENYSNKKFKHLILQLEQLNLILILVATETIITIS